MAEGLFDGELVSSSFSDGLFLKPNWYATDRSWRTVRMGGGDVAVGATRMRQPLILGGFSLVFGIGGVIGAVIARDEQMPLGAWGTILALGCVFFVLATLILALGTRIRSDCTVRFERGADRGWDVVDRDGSLVASGASVRVTRVDVVRLGASVNSYTQSRPVVQICVIVDKRPQGDSPFVEVSPSVLVREILTGGLWPGHPAKLVRALNGAAPGNAELAKCKVDARPPRGSEFDRHVYGPTMGLTRTPLTADHPDRRRVRG